MLTHTTTERVRYAETDKMGYLYYGEYPRLYEIGRVEMLRSLKLSYRSMEDEMGVMMPVMSLQCRYVRPAYYDDELELQTTLRQLPGRTITFHTEIFNPAGKLVNGGTVKLCFVDQKTGQRAECPEVLLRKLRPYFGE